MPERNSGITISGTNNEASSTISQYRVAVLDTTAEDGIKLPAGANAGNIVGVAHSDIAAGETGSLTVTGIEYVAVSEAVSIGDELVVADNTGKVKPKAAGATAQGLGIVGRALRAATADGDRVPCMLQIRNEYSS